jgi:hypothetical protein
LIFGLPPAEVAIHPSDKNNVHEFNLMCDDIKAFIKAMNKRNITCSSVQDEGWSLLTQLTLPGVAANWVFISPGMPVRKM